MIFNVACCKRYEKRFMEPTSMAKEIGLGPTVFLMQTKTLAWYFFVIFLINLPQMMIFKAQQNNLNEQDFALMYPD